MKGSKVQAGGITGTQLAANAVDAGKIADGSVGTADLSANAVTSDRIANGSIQTEDLSAGLQTSLVLPGTVVPYAGSSVPANSGWLLCDGRAVSRTQYAALFAAIGTTHGVGDAATTFNLPDYRGRFLRGVDDPDGAGGQPAAGRDPDAAARTAMASGGNVAGAVGSVQGDEFKSHGHQLSRPLTQAAGGQIFGGPGPTGARAPDQVNNPSVPEILAEAVGGSETRPKNAYVNYLIKH